MILWVNQNLNSFKCVKIVESNFPIFWIKPF